MAEYEVRYKILEPDSMDRNGKIKFRNTGYINSGGPITVTADSPEEAKKIARRSAPITNALDRATKNTDFNVLQYARPRVSFGEVTVKGGKGGGGAMPQTPGDIIGRGRSSGKMTPKLAKGGLVKKPGRKSFRGTSKS